MGFATSKAARSPEELFPLVEYCRAGKLKEVSEWIAAGRPIDPPQSTRRSRRRTPLQIAIDKGFFALAELLLDGGCDPTANGNALSDAVEHRNAEVAKLLLSRGVPADSLHIQTIFAGGREIVRLFLDHGIDPTAEFAYFHALCSTVQPLLFVLKDHKEQFPDLQRQAEMALCYYSREGNLRSISLLLWAGARPDAKVPHPDHPDDEDFLTSALDEAVHADHLDIIKRLKPQNYPDALKTLLENAWGSVSQPTVDYLLSVGATLNSKPNVGSRLLERLICDLRTPRRSIPGVHTSGKIEATIALIEKVVKSGARWVPNDPTNLRDLRDHFRYLESERVLRVFRILKEGGAATPEFLESLLDSPAFRTRLGVQAKAIEHVLHPPCSRGLSRSRLRELKAAETVAPAKPPPGIGEVRLHAREVLLDVIRQSPRLHFTQCACWKVTDAKVIRKRFGLAPDDKRDVHEVFRHAAEGLNKRLRSFRIEVENWGRGESKLIAKLLDDAEWEDATGEAWSFAQSPNEQFLTDAGLRLFEVVQNEPLNSDFVTEKSITWKLGLYGREQCLERYLEEVVTKTDLGLRWDAKNLRWGEKRMYRLWIEPQETQLEAKARCLNVRFENRFDHFKKADLDRARLQVHEALLGAKSEGTEPIRALSISSRRELRDTLPKRAMSGGAAIAEFIQAICFNKSLTVGYDFRDEAPEWYLLLKPKTDWATSLAWIEEELSRPTLQQRFGLSDEAAKLLAWIEDLPSDKMLGSWTPIVEDAREKWIGIESPYNEENFRAYLQMLIDEIHERTDYDLRIQPWHEYGRVKSRIHIARKRTEVEDVIRHLQWLALKRNVPFAMKSARMLVEQLLGGAEKLV